MNEQQALDLLAQATGTIATDRKSHEAMATALNVLRNAVAGKMVPKALESAKPQNTTEDSVNPKAKAK